MRSGNESAPASKSRDGRNQQLRAKQEGDRDTNKKGRVEIRLRVVRLWIGRCEYRHGKYEAQPAEHRHSSICRRHYKRSTDDERGKGDREQRKVRDTIENEEFDDSRQCAGNGSGNQRQGSRGTRIRRYGPQADNTAHEGKPPPCR